MKRHAAIFATFLSLAALFGCAGQKVYIDKAPAIGTMVRLMRGAGTPDLSAGVDQIGEDATKINGVSYVAVYDYTQEQQVATDIANDPPGVREVVGGYSCGADAAPVAAAGVVRAIDLLVVIQPSEYCAYGPIPKNVKRAQETYNPNFADTGGLGALLLTPGPGFNPANFTVIVRPDCHLCADTDPDAQRDVLDAIASVASPALGMRMRSALKRSSQPTIIVRHKGERILK